jgi:hypothetical protein
MHLLGFRFAPPQAIFMARLRRLRATLSPFGWIAVDRGGRKRGLPRCSPSAARAKGTVERVLSAYAGLRRDARLRSASARRGLPRWSAYAQLALRYGATLSREGQGFASSRASRELIPPVNLNCLRAGISVNGYVVRSAGKTNTTFSCDLRKLSCAIFSNLAPVSRETSCDMARLENRVSIRRRKNFGQR